MKPRVAHPTEDATVHFGRDPAIPEALSGPGAGKETPEGTLPSRKPIANPQLHHLPVQAAIEQATDHALPQVGGLAASSPPKPIVWRLKKPRHKDVTDRGDRYVWLPAGWCVPVSSR
jgi:hypothetical protein